MTRQKRIANRGIVCGPLNMLKDYTQDDMSRMREAGRQAALEREEAIMETILGIATEVPKQQVPQSAEKNPYGNNRKARRALKAETRKAKKQFDKIKAQTVKLNRG